MKKNAWIQGGMVALLLMITSIYFLSRHVSVNAQTPTLATSDATPTDEPTPEPTIELKGPAIALAFSIPGIATQGGNIKPLHPERGVAVLIYKTDVNTADSSVDPLYTIQSKVTFDTDPNSPTYGMFVNKRLDLGDKVEPGQYQIVFKIDQALQKLITQNDTDIGGILVDLADGDPTDTPPQHVILGDIIPSPHGDNVIDISDYNAFIDCYGAKVSSSDCTAKQGADFDDNGVVDGIDYNLMIRSFQSLLAMGLPVPTLAPSVVPTAAISPTKLPSPPVKKQVQATSSGNPLGGIFIFLLFIIIIVCAVLYFINPKFKALVQRLIKKLPLKMPQKKGTPKAIPPTDQAAPIAAAEEKEYYIKKQSDDDAKTGVWLEMTDDKGQTLGHYTGTDAVDGFAKVVGEMKTENGKTFLEITKLTAEA